MTLSSASRPSRVAENLAQVRERIAAAARRAGRRPEDVTLVGVTKYVEWPVIELLIAAGCHDLGESRPQQLWDRAARCEAAAAATQTNSAATVPGPAVRWHLIGHLQRNKVERTIGLVHLIHSADSRRLLEACGQAAARLGRVARVLLEVNISGDAAKHGFTPDELLRDLPALAAVPGIEIRGLMAMAGLDADEHQTRQQFAAVRTLRDQLRSTVAPALTLDELSMGMSGDFEIAIEEGATLVRVGSALFEGIDA